MNTTDIELFIFDFDGTLYNLDGFTKRLLVRLGLRLFWANQERKLRHHIMGSFYGSTEIFQKEYFTSLGKICRTCPEKVQKWYHEKYMPAMVETLKKHFTKREGVDQLLEKLKKDGKKIVVFSDYCMVKERCAAVGIDTSMMDNFLSAEELGGLKPAAEPFLKIAEMYSVAPEKCLVIGDRFDTDGLGAKNAGMNFLLVKTHKTRAEDLSKAVEFEEIIERF
ncbi:MAG: HAD family hydrolase [Treponema sp.]|nr:HAD family hydrolase [Candidatus Treponema equifaecale]